MKAVPVMPDSRGNNRNRFWYVTRATTWGRVTVRVTVRVRVMVRSGLGLGSRLGQGKIRFWYVTRATTWSYVRVRFRLGIRLSWVRVGERLGLGSRLN